MTISRDSLRTAFREFLNGTKPDGSTGFLARVANGTVTVPNGATKDLITSFDNQVSSGAIDVTKVDGLQKTYDFLKQLTSTPEGKDAFIQYSRLEFNNNATDAALLYTSWTKAWVTNVTGRIADYAETANNSIQNNLGGMSWPSWASRENFQDIVDHPIESGKKLLKWAGNNPISIASVIATYAGFNMMKDKPVMALMLIVGGLMALGASLDETRGHPRENSPPMMERTDDERTTHRSVPPTRVVDLRTPVPLERDS